MKKMSKVTKIVLALLGIALVVVGIYVAQYLIRFTFYKEYTKYAQDYSYYEVGKEFTPLSGGSAELATDFSLAAENDNFRLYIDTKTCNVALEQKSTGEIFYTNPYPLGEMAEEGLKQELPYFQLQSQVLVDYYMEDKPTLLLSYSSYGDCVGLELNEGEEVHYKIESIENGLRVIYTLGKTGTETGMVPKYLTQERYDELVAKLTEVGGTKLAKQGIRGKYAPSDDYEGYLELHESNINPFSLNKIGEALSQIGYTMDDYYADMEKVGAEVAEPVTIQIPLEYRLTADGMETNVPTEQIKENGGAVVYEVAVLPFFNAEPVEGSDGYMLVPNGSGALIDYNNGLMSNNVYYSEFVYGQDLLTATETIEDIVEEGRLPLFGIQKDSSTMLVTLDDGQSFARIIAFTSGALSKYNYVYASYRLRGYEMVYVEGQADPLAVLEDELYSAYLKQTYHVLPDTEEYDGYAGMAKYYREMLFGNDESSADSVITNEEEDIKFYLDLIGAVQRESSVLGFKYDETLAMTTYEEAKEIINTLYGSNVNNLVVNYKGWMNEGYYHDTVDNIKLVRKLGSKKELAALKKLIEEKGGALYGDLAIQYVSFAADDYNYTAQSSRYYGQGYAASFGKIGPTTYSRSASLGYIENLYDLLSPKFLPKYVGYMIEEMEEVEMTGVSLRDLGNVLYSDKKRKELISREYAQHINEAMFEQISAMDKQLMLNNPLDFALPYADDVTNISFYKNAYVYVNDEVPFYAMVMHGYVDYCGKVYNLNANNTVARECLEMIEAGASPHFVFTHERSSELKYTALNDHFSTEFATWKDTAISMYSKVNEVLRQVSNSTMDSHEINGDIVTVGYSNGVVITIDNANLTVTVDNNSGTTTYNFQ